MGLLRLFLLPLFLISCGDDVSITKTIKVRVDSFISSADQGDHSLLSYLQLQNASGREDRILLKIPTEEENEEDMIDSCFDNPNICAIFAMPLYILVSILTTCEDAILEPQNLTSAILILNTSDGSNVSSGTVRAELLRKPWWHSANWYEAFPFSREGIWSSPGGDINLTETFELNCENLSSGSCANGEMKFEMTDFFKDLISNPGTLHYGMRLRAVSTLDATQFYSVQANSEFSPRIEATYTGSCSNAFQSQKKVFYLGDLP